MSPSALLPSDSVVTADVVPLLQKYAEDVNSAVKVINSYCSSEGLPHPSFDLQAPKSTIPPTAPLNVQLARQSLIASANAIQQLAKEPADYLPHLAIHVCPPSLLNANFPPYSYGLDLRHLLAVIESHIVSFTDPQFQYQYLACLHWLCHFDILKHIPEKPIAYAELASIAGVPELQLRSVVRMINTSNFLCEPNPDHVAHNAVSRLFVTNSSLMDWANYMAQYSAPAAASFAKATAKWGKTDRKDQTAFSIATDFTGTLFEYYAQSPELANCFASYMRSVQSSQGTSLRHLLTGYDWAVLSKALVVDVRPLNPIDSGDELTGYTGWWLDLQLQHSPRRSFSRLDFHRRGSSRHHLQQLRHPLRPSRELTHQHSSLRLLHPAARTWLRCLSHADDPA